MASAIQDKGGQDIGRHNNRERILMDMTDEEWRVINATVAASCVSRFSRVAA